jgi:FkbH-like protein
MTLAELHHAGRLASCYPAVREMLAGLPPADLMAAGHVLSRLDPAEVLRAHPGVRTVTIAITGYGTLAQLIPLLTAELARHGLLLRSYLGDFGSYVAELGDPGSPLYAAEPDLALCVLDPIMIFDELPVPWWPQDAERAARDKLALISRLAARFHATSRGTLVLNTLPLLRRFTAQIVDHRSRARLSAVWHEANARLLRLADTQPSLVVLDLAPIIAEGIAAEDVRLSHYAQAHLSTELLAHYAREVGHLARHIDGQTKKVLAVDLDGTLWGGVLGEDGPRGINAADGRQGAAFRAFQQVIKQLSAQGVLLAAVSKNDPEPVRAVWQETPGMILREEDFVQITANWRPKHENLSELAEVLNLGVDSMVFVDDNPAECGFVRQALPGVAVVEVSSEPARHAERLLRDGWFDSRELMAEDRSRAAEYRGELARKSFLDSFESLEDYLRQLEITTHVSRVRAGDAEVSRVSQLTLRTNQFNLTGGRLQPADVRSLLDDPDALVVALRAADRFGDNGIVGAAFVSRSGDGMNIRNFLLSCRVFSRGIEQAGLTAILRHARAAGAAAVWGSYRATAKNNKVKDFYLRNGFTQVAADGMSATFRHDLVDIPPPPQHIHLTESLGEP